MRGEEGPHIAQHQRPAESDTGTFITLNAFKFLLHIHIILCL